MTGRPLAIRMGPLADASFHARVPGRSRRAVVAAPRYLQQGGVPQEPGGLVRHRCFNFRRPLDEWPFRLGGQTVHLPVQDGMLTHNGETMRQLTLDGLGVSRLAMLHVAAELQAGRLVELLPGYNPGDTEEVSAIFRNQRHMPLRVRAFTDLLVESVSPLLAA
ncbi:LysR substrate-binding domain-containing protein [Massilia sp. Root351]|uniref:LysR substrate-binding domain-containing protein n=1 Tax=Massilia sp. Root351 TaxID=1736522 RepID=UPI000ACB5957|nr:LysR substrate-binding domain-containing protein [Massilia sp. Root351]